MDVYAHRSNGFGFFESSKKAVKACIASNTTNVEIDIRLSADRQWVCMHDAYLDRESQSTGLVNQHNSDALKKIKLIDGQYISLLEDILPLFKNTKTKLLIEIKGGGEEQQLADLLTKHDMLSRTIVATWNPRGIEALKQANSKIQTCLFYVPIPRAFAPLRYHKQMHFDGDHVNLCLNKPHAFPKHLHGAVINSIIPDLPTDYVGVPGGLITDNFYARVRRTGRNIIAFGVNSPGHARRLRTQGVDAIVTNRPTNIL